MRVASQIPDFAKLKELRRARRKHLVDAVVKPAILVGSAYISVGFLDVALKFITYFKYAPRRKGILMVKIRLSRQGTKARPFYHVVVTDERSSRDGRNIERVGYFNPVAMGKEVPLQLDLGRVAHWVGNGAQPTEKVRSLIKRARNAVAPVAVAALLIYDRRCGRPRERPPRRSRCAEN